MKKSLYVPAHLKNQDNKNEEKTIRKEIQQLYPKIMTRDNFCIIKSHTKAFTSLRFKSSILDIDYSEYAKNVYECDKKMRELEKAFKLSFNSINIKKIEELYNSKNKSDIIILAKRINDNAIIHDKLLENYDSTEEIIKSIMDPIGLIIMYTDLAQLFSNLKLIDEVCFYKLHSLDGDYVEIYSRKSLEEEKNKLDKLKKKVYAKFSKQQLDDFDGVLKIANSITDYDDKMNNFINEIDDENTENDNDSIYDLECSDDIAM